MTSGRGGPRRSNRRGVAAFWVIGLLPVFLGLWVMSVDLGFIWLARVQLDNAAAAGALAGAQRYGIYAAVPMSPDPVVLRTEAKEFAEASLVLQKTIAVDATEDPSADPPRGYVQLGAVDGTTFTVDGSVPPGENFAVRVVTVAQVDSLWAALLGPYTIRGSAVAIWDDATGATLVHIDTVTGP